MAGSETGAPQQSSKKIIELIASCEVKVAKVLFWGTDRYGNWFKHHLLPHVIFTQRNHCCWNNRVRLPFPTRDFFRFRLPKSRDAEEVGAPGERASVRPALCGIYCDSLKRRRAAAIQNLAEHPAFHAARSVLECARPLALF
jgi:hypothetical protein